MQQLAYIFITFLIYSVLGWFIETNLTIITEKKVVNRGFLMGPYCPIYGVGCMTIIYLLKRYSNDLITLFVMATVICSIIEYLTSLIMEKIYNARWWDYTNYPFNLNGRICLSNSILFGLGGALITNVNPYVDRFLHSIPLKTFNTITIIIAFIYLADLIISFNVVSKVKNMALAAREDNTEEITEKISQILKEKTGNVKRLILAFPNAKVYKKKKKRKNRTF